MLREYLRFIHSARMGYIGLLKGLYIGHGLSKAYIWGKGLCRRLLNDYIGMHLGAYLGCGILYKLLKGLNKAYLRTI
jgi:hypothetical protein